MVGFWVWHFDAATTVCKGTDGMQLGGWFVEDKTSTLPLEINSGAPPAQVGQFIVRLVE